MLLSSTCLPNAATTVWETSFARKFLQIPKEQLEVINKLSEWSDSKTPSNTSGVLREKIESQSIYQSTSVEINCLNHTSSLLKEKDNFEALKKNKTISSEKEFCLKTIPLLVFPREGKSTCKLKRSNSLPNIFQQQPLISTIHQRKFGKYQKSNSSILFATNPNSPINMDECLKRAGIETINTKTVPEFYHNKSASCPLQEVVESSKKDTCNKSDNTLSQNGLKSLKPSIVESESLPGPSGCIMQSICRKIASSSRSHEYENTGPIKMESEDIITLDVLTESKAKSLNAYSAITKKVEDSSGKQMQIKKKRESKEEKSSKKRAKKFRKADIKFTMDQISNMVDLIRVFQTDIFV